MGSPPTPLCSWLRRLYSVLLAKFTLYWYSILHSGATNPTDLQEAVMNENPAIVSQCVVTVLQYMIGHCLKSFYIHLLF